MDLQVRVFNDYVQPNDQVVQGQIDVNYFQTEPYLDAYNRDRGAGLVTLAGIHIEPFGAYSRRYDSLDAVPEGADARGIIGTVLVRLIAVGTVILGALSGFGAVDNATRYLPWFARQG